MQENTCPKCHTAVRSTDFFCFNCGANLKPKPLSTNLSTQLLLYLGALLLPPMGIIWGIRRLKEKNQASQIIGIIAIVLTMISLVVSIVIAVNIINQANTQLSRQLQLINGY